MSQTAWERQPPDHEITQNDVGTLIEDILTDSKGNVVDLTGATVRYQARFPGQPLSSGIDKDGTVPAPSTDGRARLTVVAGDTDLHGTLEEQWKVTFGGGAVERFPARKHKLLIQPDSATP